MSKHYLSGESKLRGNMVNGGNCSRVVRMRVSSELLTYTRERQRERVRDPPLQP